MPVFPGPPVLGRGVVILPGDDLPPMCAEWPRIVVDAAALDDPGPAADALHENWLTRRPCVVVLDVEAAALRQAERCERDVWELGEGFEFARERLQYLVWSNNYDLRGDEPIWWHGRRAERLGARAASGAADGDVVLPGGQMAWCDGRASP
jgi:hypothetical protein